MPETADFWINHLQLKAHPEGGYFKEVYRSGEFIQKRGLPSRYNSFRSFSTSIYFLLKSHEFSAFHRLKSDEGWHFYKGSPLQVHILLPGGKLVNLVLGGTPTRKEHLQFTIPKGSWFAAKPIEKDSYSLIGCTVAPGFDFDDFELAKTEELLRAYPQHRKLILNFTRKS